MNQPNLKKTGEVVAANDIPWQALQEFYHKIVSEKQNLRKRFTDPYQYQISDIEDLHHRLFQVAKGYTLTTSAFKITVTYTDESDLCVSDFEQFKLLSATGAKATREIELEYNFYITHSETGEGHNYKINIDLASGIAIFSEIQKNVPKHIWNSIGYMTGRTKIEYVNYTIGQNFLSTISSWFESRTLAQSVKIIDWIQEKSQWIPIILKNVFLIIASLVALGAATDHLTESSSIRDLATFLIVSLCGIMLSYEIGLRAGKAIESSVDKIWKLAFIKLNEGDKRLLEEIKGHNKNCWISVMWRTIIAIILSVIPKIFATLILNVG